MALQHLTDEQIRDWSRKQKDEWWLKNVYRGEMPQLTLRSALVGFLLGGILSATALYVAAKTGVGIGVGLTSVILAFAMFRMMASTGLVKDFSILENNCSQSIATAAGYMTSPLISSLAAYMILTNKVLEPWQMMVWMFVVSILGVLIAFPMKRRFINDDQLPFPEGRASGVVLDSLYHGEGDKGMFQARLLGKTAVGVGLYQMIQSDGWMNLIQFKLLRMDKWAGMKAPWTLPEKIDDYYYELAAKYDWWMPKIMGTPFKTLGLRLGLDGAMFGIGGLMGIRVASSVLIGAVVNFAILAPIMIDHGDIHTRMVGTKLINISRAEIVNQWAMWWGVGMMVAGSLTSLFARPEVFTSVFKNMMKKRTKDDGETDVLKDIEVPLWISYVGVPIFSVLGAMVNHYFFGVPWLLSFIAFPLIFVLTVICTNSMALTSWTPTGALSKITQFSIGALDRTNPASNLLPAGMTSEISANAANLLSDIKPGYMLGGKPRHQVIGHIIGIIAGSVACVPLFFLLFLRPDANGVRSAANIITEQFAFPAAIQWKGVAELIANGVSHLPMSAIITMLVAMACAVVIEVLKIRTNGRFPLSAVSIGLGVVLPPDASFAMWLGAFAFWWMGRKHKQPGTRGHDIWVEGCEPICAGLISGAALVGIGNALVNVMLG
jgi:OPT family oligopeptide transporter